MKDHSIVGEGVPMVSASMTPVNLHDVLYSGQGEASRYDDDVKFETQPWRVIQINYKERYYRVRGAEGCEQTVFHDEGCPRTKMFHKFDELKTHIRAQLDREGVRIRKEIEEHKATLKKIDDVKATIKHMASSVAPPKAEVAA